MRPEIDFAGREICGSREYQEDYYGFFDCRSVGGGGAGDMLMVLADGMGGHVGGAHASRATVEAFIGGYEAASGTIPERLRSALEVANGQLTSDIRANPSLAGMGCTLVGAVVAGDQLYWISVGDSLLYVRSAEGLKKLNADHSMAPLLDAMAAKGEMSEADALASPDRNALRSALIGEVVELVDAPDIPRVLTPGDLVIIASDGLQTLDDAQISSCVEPSSQDADQIATALLSAVEAEGKPRQDNTTVLIWRHATASNIGRANAHSKIMPHVADSGQAASKTKSKRAILIVVAAATVAVAGIGGYLYLSSAPKQDGRVLATDAIASPDNSISEEIQKQGKQEGLAEEPKVEPAPKSDGPREKSRDNNAKPEKKAPQNDEERQK